MNNLSKLFSILADPVRLSILESLYEKKECVSELKIRLKRSQPNISQHLRVLKLAKLVESKRDGKKTCYFLKSRDIKKLIDLAKKVDLQLRRD